MGGKASRRKGHDFERALVHRFRAVMPGAAIKRGLQSQGGTAAAPDVDVPCFWVEAKRGAKPNVRAALKQATDAAPAGRTPIAIVKDDRQPAFVVMALDDFLELVEEWWARSQA